MGKPKVQDIADALCINSNQVSSLQKRGMPINKIKNAREWFEANGFHRVHHGKSGGAANNGPSMATTINAAIGGGRGVIPSNT